MKVSKTLIACGISTVALALMLRWFTGCATKPTNVTSATGAYGWRGAPPTLAVAPPQLGPGEQLNATSPSTSELWVIERKPANSPVGAYEDTLRYPTDPKMNGPAPRGINPSQPPQSGGPAPAPVLIGSDPSPDEYYINGQPVHTHELQRALQAQQNQMQSQLQSNGSGGAGGGGAGSGRIAEQADDAKVSDGLLSGGAAGNRRAAAPPGAFQNPMTKIPANVDRETQQPATVDLGSVTPGCGELIIQDHNGRKNVPIPLDHTEVTAQIQGYVASVHVEQRYRNPYGEKIEAVYVFPLPQDAAVNEFVMTIGDRHIRGIIRERAEAERIYHEARAQGYVASLLTQERPNIFTQSVANIEPNKKIDINITYFNTMSYVDGSYEFVFPMVVGPRFNLPGSTEGVGAVGRGRQGISGQKTEVQYLRPDERSGSDIGLSVDLNAGVPIEQLDSRNHKITVKQESPSHAIVSLDPADSIPNKDFVLRYKVAGAKVKSGMFVQRDDHGGYFTLMLFPPATLAQLPRQPMEMVFTIDVSGSQSGAPLAQEKAATKYCLTHMNPSDTFQVVRFGDTAKTLFATPMPANEKNVQEALSYVDGLDATEGTMLVEGVHASLLFPHDESRLRFVAFMTDGFIGNEGEALREIHNCLGPARIFSFGVGSSTNRYLLDHMAKMGNGAAAYLGLNDDANQVMGDYFQRISHPAMTDISLDLGTMNASEVFPQRICDLFVGRPVVISGRFSGNVPKQVVVHGRVGGRTLECVVPVSAENVESGPSHALASVWARAKLAELGDRAVWEQNTELPAQMKQVALAYGLVSDYTSFVAVDSLTKTSGDHGITIAVPVPVPDGVRYETTVQEGTARGPEDR